MLSLQQGRGWGIQFFKFLFSFFRSREGEEMGGLGKSTCRSGLRREERPRPLEGSRTVTAERSVDRDGWTRRSQTTHTSDFKKPQWGVSRSRVTESLM